jgi:hypothetical protein
VHVTPAPGHGSTGSGPRACVHTVNVTRIPHACRVWLTSGALTECLVAQVPKVVLVEGREEAEYSGTRPLPRTQSEECGDHRLPVGVLLIGPVHCEGGLVRELSLRQHDLCHAAPRLVNSLHGVVGARAVPQLSHGPA